MGGILFFLGIMILFPSASNGNAGMVVLGIILMVLGGFLFWRTSATKAYLDQNKKNR